MGYYYVQVNSVCLLVLLTVLLTLRRTTVLPARRVAFTRLICIAMIICVFDILAWYLVGKQFPGSRALLYFCNMVYYGAITWESYAWLDYVNLRTKSLEDNFHRKRLDAIPLLVMLLLIVTTPVTKLLFSISEDCVYHRESGVFLHWLISWGYLVYVTARVILKIRTARSRVEKSQLLPMLWFVVPPAGAAVLQMFFYGLTSTQCGLTIAILIIAITYLSGEISRDALTGLNNRRAMESRLQDILQGGTAELAVLMCDVDHFKSINDTLGHTAGDLVLKRMAGALKRACGTFSKPVFLCRYGGDEFLIFGSALTDEDIRRLTEAVETAVSAVSTGLEDGLRFSISVGAAVSECDSIAEVEGLIGIADAAMYKEKTRRHAEEAKR